MLELLFPGLGAAPLFWDDAFLDRMAWQKDDTPASDTDLGSYLSPLLFP